MFDGTIIGNLNGKIRLLALSIALFAEAFEVRACLQVLKNTLNETF